MDKSLYSRPNKPKFLQVTKRARDFALDKQLNRPTILAVAAHTECHVTRDDIAARMVSYLDLDDGMNVIDPQCGTGNLVHAVLQSGFDTHITAIEKNVELFNAFLKRFPRGNVAVQNKCFLEYATFHGGSYDRVISNPPFRSVKQHIAASLRVLKEEGSMVALVPITFNYAGSEHLETLDRGDFECTQALTKLIRIYK